MKRLVVAEFADGRAPADWQCEIAGHRFEPGRLDIATGAGFRVPLPGRAWRKVRVEVRLLSVPKELGIGCIDDNRKIFIKIPAGPYGRHYVAKHHDRRQLGWSHTPVGLPAGRMDVAFEFDGARLAGFVDGREVVCGEYLRGRAAAGWLWLNFTGEATVERIEVLGEGEEEIAPCVPAPRSRRDFQLEVCVDFFDDLMRAPFTQQTFKDMFAEFKSWGVSRCHWIYYGGRKNGWWDFAPLGVAETAAKTFDNVGDIIKTAVESAHAEGIELFGLVKPFDIGCFYNVPAHRAGASKPRANRIVGGNDWVTYFVAEHPEFLMARRPDAWGEAENRAFTRIDIVKEDELPCAFGVKDVDLYVSDDNLLFRRYEGPVRRSEGVEDYPVYVHMPSGMWRTAATRRARVLRLDGLSVASRYMALSAPGRAGSFSNRLGDMVHVFGERGEERKITFGWGLQEGEGGFQSRGIIFGYDPGTPTAIFQSFDAMEGLFTLDEGQGVLGIARGKDRSPLAALSPSFTESRNYWLSWVKDVLDAGADGVELRVRNHHSDLAWSECGFETPLVEEFRSRFGIDLLKSDDFDRALWRRLRGEAYTQFIREARALVLLRGKRLGLHISPTFDIEPEEGAAMEIHWDWRRWLDEGLADSVTMKEVWPHTRLAEEILCRTRKRGTPVIFCPFNSDWSGPHNLALVGARIATAKAAGYDGFQFYEAAGVIEAGTDGHARMTQPALRSLFQSAVVK